MSEINETTILCDVVIFNMSIEDAESFLYTKTERFLFTIVLPLMLAVGLFLNASFAITVTRVSYMRTPTNFFLFSLAVSDSLFLVSAIGDKFVQISNSPIARDEGIYNHIGCSIRSLLVDTSYFASLFVITLVTLEKYFAVCKPIKQVRKRSKKRALKYIVITWIISFLIACTFIPLCMRISTDCYYWPYIDKYLDLPEYSIIFDPLDSVFYYSIFCQSVPFFVTLVINAVVYFRLINALGVQVATSEKRGQDPERTNRIRKLVIRMLVINGAAFFLLLAPFEVTLLLKAIQDIRGAALFASEDQARLIYMVVRMLAYVNAIINSAIYWASNKRYRDAFTLTYRPACANNGTIRTSHVGSSMDRDNTRSR